MDKVLLIDGMNQIWRACITFPPIKKESILEEKQAPDEYVLIFNFFRNLRAQIEMFAPSKCFIALEGYPQFRYDLYPDYKANRRLIKVSSQLESRARIEKGQPEILRLLKHLPITQVRAEHFEADDVIGTLVENMKEEEVVIISGDADFVQLLQKGYQHLTVYNPMTKSARVAPEHSALIAKCIMGDKSDSIKGITGYGPKKTEKLLADPEKFKEFLEQEENRSLFNINKQLIEIQMIPLEELIVEEGQTDFEALETEFQRMAFETLLKEPYWSKFKDTFSSINHLIDKV